MRQGESGRGGTGRRALAAGLALWLGAAPLAVLAGGSARAREQLPAGERGQAASADGAAEPDGGTAEGSRDSTPRRDRALERRLRAALVRAVTATEARNREQAERAWAAGDRVSRYFAAAGLLEHGLSKVRLRAARELEAIGERAAVPRLVHRLVREHDRELRLELTRVLARMDVAGTGGLFARYLDEQRPERRLRALLAMGVFPDRRVVPVLVRRLRWLASGFGQAAIQITTQHAYIRGWRLVSGGTGNQAVEVADPEVGLFQTGAVMEVKVARVEAELIVELLGELTGEQLGADPAAWEAWLRAHPEFPLVP
ncbi:MAG: hypothetical protein KatS3mg102_2826 [Planctomycetota bacterium]|nr:MAG: hypothetical protein KatS3mg102_2826 [Planctomycetota bacterium]